MSFSIPISALLLYPFLYLLPLNIVRFRWGLDEGFAPMPPEVQEKAEAADRIVRCVTDVILLVVVALLMHGSLLPAYEVGLTWDNWKPALGMGVLLSLFPLSLSELLLLNRPAEEIRKELESRGPVATWCGLITLGSLSHEFWRVFCIAALIRLGLSAWVAVLIVAAVYGTLSLQTSVASALGSVTFGGAAGFLFVNTGSLLAPVTMSIIVGVANLYRVRNASSTIERIGTNEGIHRLESRYSRSCPVCGATIRLSEGYRAVDMLACPTCGEALTTDKKYLWGIAVVSLVTAAYVTRHLVYREPAYLFATEGLALVLFLVGTFLLGLLVPPTYKRAGGKTFDKALSLFGTDESDAGKKSSRK
jgi:hypothetical protein